MVFPEYLLHVRLVQITLVTPGEELRLRRLICGKALPFRRAPDLNSLLRAGWKAVRSSLHGGRRQVRGWQESRRLSASRGGGAALSAGVSW